HSDSLPILEFWAMLHNELNRETQYFEILIKLFDLTFAAGNVPRACDTIEKLLDIDPYDHRNQQRIDRLRGKADEAFLKRVSGCIARSGSVGSQHPAQGQPQAPESGGAAQGTGDDGRKAQALEDLIVQTEIFLQYSLHAKAVERLEKIAAMFPGEEERHTRLRNLYQTANWWPKGAPKAKAPEPAPKPSAAPAPPAPTATPAPKGGMFSAETIRDLSKISEINQKIFRQQTPRAMLNTAVNEVGGYLHASRALAVVGSPGRPPEMAAEFCG